MNTTYLSIKWTVSRGRETYGYNIVTLTASTTGKRYSCNGGGYDMKGTVFGQWLEDVHQDALVNIGHRAHSRLVQAEPHGTYERIQSTRSDSLYGMTEYDEPSQIKGDAARGFRRISVKLDGACGLDSMRRIAEAIDLTVVAGERDRNGNALGYIVTADES